MYSYLAMSQTEGGHLGALHWGGELTAYESVPQEMVRFHKKWSGSTRNDQVPQEMVRFHEKISSENIVLSFSLLDCLTTTYTLAGTC